MLLTIKLYVDPGLTVARSAIVRRYPLLLPELPEPLELGDAPTPAKKPDDTIPLGVHGSEKLDVSTE